MRVRALNLSHTTPAALPGPHIPCAPARDARTGQAVRPPHNQLLLKRAPPTIDIGGARCCPLAPQREGDTRAHSPPAPLDRPAAPAPRRTPLPPAARQVVRRLAPVMARARRREVKRVPRTDASLPEYDPGAHPEGLLTRRQLRDEGLSPGGHDPVGILRCKACAYRPQWSCVHPTRAWLWRRDLARPKRTPTLAQEWALDRAMAARQTCPRCGRRYYFCLQAAVLH